MSHTVQWLLGTVSRQTGQAAQPTTTSLQRTFPRVTLTEERFCLLLLTTPTHLPCRLRTQGGWHLTSRHQPAAASMKQPASKVLANELLKTMKTHTIFFI